MTEQTLKAMTVKLPPTLLKRLHVVAAQTDTSLQTLVEALLTVGLRHWDPK